MAIKVKVGLKRRDNAHPKNRINNTTMDFGSVQPTFKQFVQRKDRISVQASQLVRLAPMPLPTLANISIENRAVFVPFTDICPLHDSLLSSIPYNGFVPQWDFTCNAYVIRNLVLNMSYPYLVTVKKNNATGQVEISNPVPFDLTSADNQADASFIETNYSYTPKKLYSESIPYDSTMSIDSADYIVRLDDVIDNPYITDRYVLYRFSPKAKRLRKIFLGLGYQLTDANNSISFSPILAFYKAYFDTYYPQRLLNWNSTACYYLINSSLSKSVVNNQNGFTTLERDMTSDVNVSSVQTAFSRFIIEELSNCFMTQDMDLISLCQQNINNNTFRAIPANADKYNVSHSSSLGVDLNYSPFVGTNDYITKSSLDILRHLTHFVNKDTVIGKKVSSWIKSHYGDDVYNTLYSDSFMLGRWATPVKIGDVMSTAETATSDSGDFLGSYAGVGKGGGNIKFNFTAPDDGFVFVLSSVNVYNNYYQGIDPELFMIDKYSYPTQEFDAIGWELLPNACVLPNNDFTSTASFMTNQSQNGSFGYLPRYSMYKFSQDCINGDLSRRGTKSSYSPYTINKDIVNVGLTGEGKFVSHDIPTAGIEWQFLGKWDYLTHYNRIFYVTKGIDNFIVHTGFKCLHTNKLKPISTSYDTVCENDDSTNDVVVS